MGWRRAYRPDALQSWGECPAQAVPETLSAALGRVQRAGHHLQEDGPGPLQSRGDDPGCGQQLQGALLPVRSLHMPDGRHEVKGAAVAGGCQGGAGHYQLHLPAGGCRAGLGQQHSNTATQPATQFWRTNPPIYQPS